MKYWRTILQNESTDMWFIRQCHYRYLSHIYEAHSSLELVYTHVGPHHRRGRRVQQVTVLPLHRRHWASGRPKASCQGMAELHPMLVHHSAPRAPLLPPDPISSTPTTSNVSVSVTDPEVPYAVMNTCPGRPGSASYVIPTVWCTALVTVWQTNEGLCQVQMPMSLTGPEAQTEPTTSQYLDRLGLVLSIVPRQRTELCQLLSARNPQHSGSYSWCCTVLLGTGSNLCFHGQDSPGAHTWWLHKES